MSDDAGWGGEAPPPAETFEDWTEVDVLRAIGRELRTQTKRLDAMYVCLWILAALAVLNLIGAFLWIFGVVTIDVNSSSGGF